MVEGLPENIQKEMKLKGFEDCRGILSFTRYVNERNDVGLEEYIKMFMDEEDYKEYLSYYHN